MDRSHDETTQRDETHVRRTPGWKHMLCACRDKCEVRASSMMDPYDEALDAYRTRRVPANAEGGAWRAGSGVAAVPKDHWQPTPTPARKLNPGFLERFFCWVGACVVPFCLFKFFLLCVTNFYGVDSVKFPKYNA